MRRGVLIAVAAVLTVAAILGVLAFFSARDDSTIGGDEGNAPGEPAPDVTSPQLERGNVVLFFSTPADRDVPRALAEEFGPESLADLDDLAADLEKAIGALARTAGVRRKFGTRRRTRTARSPALPT